jgi:hypothetical protein
MLLRPFTLIAALAVTGPGLGARPRASAPGVVRGVVRDTLGHPKRGVLVQLVADAATPSRSRHRWLVAIDTTDQGRFEFSSVAPQRYVLVAHRPLSNRGTETPITSANDTVSTVVRFLELDLSEPSAPERAEALASLAKAQARWASQRPTRYRLTAQLDCYCAEAKDGARALEFAGDSLVAVIQNGDRPSTGAESWLTRFVIPALFAHANAEVRNFERRVEKIELDPTYGFPTVVATNTAYIITDSWLRLYITDFRKFP